MRKDVVIYRKNKNDLLNVFSEITRHLKEHSNPCIDEKYVTIKNRDWSIEFFCGAAWRMGGIRPFLYNTDCKFASDFLEQGATKVNGKEIEDIEELLRIILEV